MKTDTIHTGDSLEWLRTLPDECVHCCVTSPPYYGLRDYGVDGQLGLEKTPEAYVATLVEVFREARRVLNDSGTLWLVIGDSYASGKGKCRNPGGNTSSFNVHLKAANVHPLDRGTKSTLAKSGLKPKDLTGIPWRVAFALQADGWWLRQDIIWHKPNPMPESVRDRCTRAHEYIFMLSKSARYYYDHEAIKTPAKNPGDDARRIAAQKPSNKSAPTGRRAGLRSRQDKQRGHGRRHAGFNDRWDKMTMAEQQANGANKRDVWTVATRAFKGAHFATYPPDLIEPCILAGCPEGGIVLDPFMGAGTTGLVAANLGRHYIGCELNPESVELAENRINNRLGKG